MGAKQELREVVEHLTEADAEAALEFIADHRRDPATVTELRDERPPTVPLGPQASRHRQLRSGLRAVAIVPASLLMGLFFIAYFALLIIVIVVIVRG